MAEAPTQTLPPRSWSVRAVDGVVAAVDALWRPPLALLDQIGSHAILLGRVVFWSVRRPRLIRRVPAPEVL